LEDHGHRRIVVTVNATQLEDHEVQIWWTSLEANDGQVEKLRRLLSAAEHRRASRFRIERARRRFIVARAALRLVLGQCTGIDPVDLVFVVGEHGKPSRVGGPFFNASDSGEFVAIAVATAEVGLDIENARTLRRADRLAHRVCTPLELDDLAELPEDERDRRILRLWTCKEAALKAIGVGLPGGAHNVEVEFSPGGSPKLTSLFGEPSGWALLCPEIHPDIVCSLVVSGSGWRAISRPFSAHSM
jgi:4'-phosphopantetheinyl transferase